jgi:hypothetical protein
MKPLKSASIGVGLFIEMGRFIMLNKADFKITDSFRDGVAQWISYTKGKANFFGNYDELSDKEIEVLLEANVQDSVEWNRIITVIEDPFIQKWETDTGLRATYFKDKEMLTITTRKYLLDAMNKLNEEKKEKEEMEKENLKDF